MYPFDRIRDGIYVRPSESAVPRLIVIDGCNIARSSCGINRANVNCAGLMALMRFLLIRDWDVVAFLPVIYNNSYNFNATNAQVLPKLQQLDVLTFTPARTARAGRPAFINYDDLYVLEFAQRHGGSVLSDDRFEDIAKEYTYKNYRRIIKERRIDVIFRPLNNDFVHYGRDRFFRFIPELCITGCCWSAEERLQQCLYCFPNDEDYGKVVNRRELWTAKRRDEIICTIDALFDEIAAKNCLVPEIIPVQISNEKEFAHNSDVESAVSPVISYQQTDPRQLTERWLSPPIFCPTRIATKKQRKLQMVQQNGATLSSASTKLAVTRPTGMAYDARCVNIISCLDQIFDRQLIVKVLRENKTRDLHTVANLCAQETL
uniref:RNase NYN domain-containing protein n=1 Tax=Setaria digitata TaxID=48799 RepID=A0A915Q7I5_9BILA